MDKRTRDYIKTIVSMFVFLIVFCIAGINPAYAVEVEGANTGLRVNVSDVLVPTDNLVPGDTKTSTMTISFSTASGIDASSLPVWLKAEITENTYGKGGGDLDDKLELTVTREDETELYRGAISGLDNAVEVGNINRNESIILTFTAHLPGEETGNEYQAASFKVKWIVITSYTAPPTPRPTRPRYRQPTETTTRVVISPTETPVEATPVPAEPTEAPEVFEMEDETIPEGVPEQTGEEENKEAPDIVIIEDELIPTGLPKTGELPPILFYGLGTGIIYTGIRLNKKKENK